MFLFFFYKNIIIITDHFFFLPKSASSVSRSQAHLAQRCSSVYTTIFVQRKDKTNYLSNQTWARCFTIHEISTSWKKVRWWTLYNSFQWIIPVEFTKNLTNSVAQGLLAFFPLRTPLFIYVMTFVVVINLFFFFCFLFVSYFVFWKA